jgi:hypothetical protein
MKKKCHPLVIRRLVGVSLLCVLIAAVTVHTSLDAANESRVTLNCAELDRRAVVAIEERYGTAGTATAPLANAHQNDRRARMSCPSGDQDQRAEFHQRDIDRDMSLSHPSAMK